MRDVAAGMWTLGHLQKLGRRREPRMTAGWAPLVSEADFAQSTLCLLPPAPPV